MKEYNYFIYILANKKNGTLYIGFTNNLIRRIREHKEKITEGFTKKYNVTNLVYYEIFNDVKDAINREKKLKKFYRKEKLELIEKYNPNWIDKFNDLF